jgi:hypothetical protein
MEPSVQNNTHFGLGLTAKGSPPNLPVSKPPVMKSKNPIWPAPAHPKPKQPVSKQSKFIMPTFKTASVKMPSFAVSRLVFDMRTKKYYSLIAEQVCKA